MVDAFLEEFRAVISSIEERPLMYPSIARRVRRALMTRFHYAIYFTVEEETIMVYAILHQARDEGRWRRRVPDQKL